MRTEKGEEVRMYNNESMYVQLQRYYSLWKDCTALYEEWAKKSGLSSNGVLVLYSFYEDDGICTQKSICQKWCIPKQTVNTILKDFLKNGYVEMSSQPDDKRNKLIRLTDTGRAFADDVIGRLHKKEMYVLEKMGLDKITSMNDNTELFIKLFREGDIKEKGE